MKIILRSCLALATVAALSSCNREGCMDSLADNYDEKAKTDDGSCTYEDYSTSLKASYKENYAAIVYANYSDALADAEALETAIESFVSTPTASTLADAKTAWLSARESYGQTEAFRFSDGPIDDADGPEGLLNAWPLDEAYIDYVNGDSDAGIINDATNFPNITASVLEGLNEEGGEENISIGYHAIEFLLWGQDDTDPSLETAGQRPYTDYVTDGTGTADNQDRRGEYLNVCADLLIEHLQLMVDEWNPNASNNYYTTFMATEVEEAISSILTGIGTLSKAELAGERMFVALDNQDQEDEHSCFSDNTHRDIILNAQGIRNVYVGSYTKNDGSTISGTSLSEIIAVVDAELATEMDALSEQTIENCQQIPVPFDNQLTQEQTGGTGPIMTAITALQTQGDKISEAGTALGLNISTELPE